MRSPDTTVGPRSGQRVFLFMYLHTLVPFWYFRSSTVRRAMELERRADDLLNKTEPGELDHQARVAVLGNRLALACWFSSARNLILAAATI